MENCGGEGERRRKIIGEQEIVQGEKMNWKLQLIKYENDENAQKERELK
jgi:hypothetical protein